MYLFVLGLVTNTFHLSAPFLFSTPHFRNLPLSHTSQQGQCFSEAIVEADKTEFLPSESFAPSAH